MTRRACPAALALAAAASPAACVVREGEGEPVERESGRAEGEGEPVESEGEPVESEGEPVESEGEPARPDAGTPPPRVDRWSPLASEGAPAARRDFSAVWTGSEMIVWGGDSDAARTVLASGGRYHPEADAWQSTAIRGGPAARTRHVAVWTGEEMIVWGGLDYDGNTFPGARYDPAADAWGPMDEVEEPARRWNLPVVWTGSEMIVWGGDVYPSEGAGVVGDGGRYHPGRDRWSPVSDAGAPAPRHAHAAVWTGSEMILWGGTDSGGPGGFANGGRYDPDADAWTPTGRAGGPAGRYHHAAVWTGRGMLVWGGTAEGGGIYDPESDRWTRPASDGAPDDRSWPALVWTGREAILWGGMAPDGPRGDGALYDPRADAWQAMSVEEAPLAGAGRGALWTGSEMIVWNTLDGQVAAGRYRP